MPLTFLGDAEYVDCEGCRQRIYRPNDDEKAMEMLDEADGLCQERRFDEAKYLYRKVHEMDAQSTRALWGLFRCKYGVEIVVEDGSDSEFTVCGRRGDGDWTNEILFQPLETAPNYRGLYNAVRNDIIEFNGLRRKNTRYDVFLCYKHTDRRATGVKGEAEATPSLDREWVARFYEALKARLPADRRIFYAPVSLKGMTGGNYAAGIDYALATSRVLVVVGSKREYFESVWVRSEWSRFLGYINQRCTRRLIPIFRGMRESELPEDLRLRQGYGCREGDGEEELQRLAQSVADDVQRLYGEPDLLDPYRRHLAAQDFAALRRRKDELEAEADQRRRENADLNARLADTRNRLAEAEEANHSLQEENRNADVLYKAAEKGRQEGIIENYNKTRQIDNLKARVAELEKKEQQRHEAEAQLDADLRHAKACAEQLDADLQEARRKLRDAEKRAEQAETKNAEDEKVLGEQEESLRTLREEAASAKEGLREARSRLSRAEAQAADLDAQRVEAQEKLNAAEKRRRAAEEKLDAAEKGRQAAEGKLAASEKSLAELREELKRTGGVAPALRQQVEALEADLAQANAQAARLPALEDELRKARAEARRATALEKELAQVRAAAAGEADRQAAHETALRSELEEMKQKAQALEQRSAVASEPPKGPEKVWRIAEYGFCYADSSGRVRRCGPSLREAAEDFHIDRIDSIYFTVRNESTKMQRGQIALVDPMGVCSASFGEERIKPHFIVEHKLAIKDPRALERSLTVQITDAAGETKEIGRLEYHGAGK